MDLSWSDSEQALADELRAWLDVTLPTLPARPGIDDWPARKAFDINSDYPAGHFLRGLFRYNEGEIAGALLLFRRAAELYDPQAHDTLAEVYSLIANCELRLNRPVAAGAALRKALHYQPSNTELQKGFDDLFGPNSRLPASARRPAKSWWPSRLRASPAARLSTHASAKSRTRS